MTSNSSSNDNSCQNCISLRALLEQKEAIVTKYQKIVQSQNELLHDLTQKNNSGGSSTHKKINYHGSRRITSSSCSPNGDTIKNKHYGKQAFVGSVTEDIDEESLRKSLEEAFGEVENIDIIPTKAEDEELKKISRLSESNIEILQELVKFDSNIHIAWFNTWDNMSCLSSFSAKRWCDALWNVARKIGREDEVQWDTRDNSILSARLNGVFKSNSSLPLELRLNFVNVELNLKKERRVAQLFGCEWYHELGDLAIEEMPDYLNVKMALAESYES
ncbi:6102_t:CDS:2 [Diversispora eburnea]|uniref:6102_t:CDS:1 n=1 Tax=Diversispora eburnea TaxID=1213867 RepID=A0A9N8V9B1_9GLOM|nr:6102_t:CDS:2 [Diversispora eburnea]